MPVIQDKEFGKITIKRSPNAKQVKVRVAPDGTLRASLPMYAPILLVKHLLMTSRDELRAILAQAKPVYQFVDGMQIGKSHKLIIMTSDDKDFSVVKKGLQIITKVPVGMSMNNPNLARKVRDTIISSLRLEAKSYLPKRMLYLADKYGFKFQKIRFSHASGRWGSCNTNGTISLNIALMKLHFELIDYVIIHELSHTKQMNHSPSFWKIVAAADSDYKLHKRELKQQNPSI